MQSSIRPQDKPPEPRPCPYYSHSQSNCAQCQQLTTWIHRGQFAQPAGWTLRRPVDLDAPAGRQIRTLAHKHHFNKLLETLRWKRPVGEEQHKYKHTATATVSFYWDFCKAIVNMHKERMYTLINASVTQIPSLLTDWFSYWNVMAVSMWKYVWVRSTFLCGAECNVNRQG